MSNDQKKPEGSATILLPPIAPNQLVIVGPFTNEEVTTYEISALQVTISKTVKSSHVGMGASSPQDSQDSKPDPVTAFMEHLAKHPEVVQAVLEKLQEMKVPATAVS